MTTRTEKREARQKRRKVKIKRWGNRLLWVGMKTFVTTLCGTLGPALGKLILALFTIG
ncbi:hypothetical protein [Priestia megaterium]|uniref:hypothetical protein n=1 Tax=Priestia megaterium TaxID=1404 RepID=UPI0031FBAD83